MNNKYYSDFLVQAAIKDCRDDGFPEIKKPASLEAKKKTMQPPTQAQLERINELKDHPEFQQHLDWLLTAIEKGMLNTRGQAGILINQMKKKCGSLTPAEIHEWWLNERETFPGTGNPVSERFRDDQGGSCEVPAAHRDIP